MTTKNPTTVLRTVQRLVSALDRYTRQQLNAPLTHRLLGTR